MARRWVVLTAARGTLPIHSIVQYTEWAGRQAAADEVIYDDPVDAGDNPIDGNWKVGGTVTRSGATYTFTDAQGQITPHDTTADLGRKRVAVESALGQLDRWDASLEASARRGQSSVVRNLGHDLILGQRKALYRVATGGAAVTVDLVESYSAMISMGALDVTDVSTFFRLAASLNKGTWVDGDPVQWATATSTTAATRRNLQAAITAAPVDFRAAVRDFSSIDLGTDAWVRTAILA